MTVSHLQAAKFLCEYSNWALTNLALQKILYVAHMFYMGQNNGERLIDGFSSEFRAWDYGPVSPSVYQHVKNFGSEPIGNVFRQFSEISDEPRSNMLQYVYGELGQWTPGQLVAFTHREGGAWGRHYSPGAVGAPISDQSIMQEYQKFHA